MVPLEWLFAEAHSAIHTLRACGCAIVVGKFNAVAINAERRWCTNWVPYWSTYVDGLSCLQKKAGFRQEILRV